MSKSKKFDYESAMPEEEVSWRMGSSAGRRLQQRLRDLDMLGTEPIGPSSAATKDSKDDADVA